MHVGREEINKGGWRDISGNIIVCAVEQPPGQRMREKKAGKMRDKGKVFSL